MGYLKNFGISTGQGRYYEEAVYGIVLLYNLIHDAISKHLGPFHLSPAKFNILMIVKHQGGPDGISQVEISDKLIVTASNTTRLLDKLEQEKLIHREAREGDRRVNVIKISERGSALLDAAWPGYLETLKKLMKEVNEKDQKVLAGLLNEWLEVLAK